MQLRVLIALPVFAMLLSPLLQARKKTETPPDRDTQLELFLQELNTLKIELNSLTTRRKKLIAELAEIRKEERKLRNQESVVRGKMTAIRKGIELDSKRKIQNPKETKITPLLEGPLKVGLPNIGTLNSINVDAKVMAISSLSEDGTISNNIFILGEKAALIANSEPKQLSDFTTPSKVRFWIHPQDASTITWLEIQPQ